MHGDMTSSQDETAELKLHDDTIQMLFAISLKLEYCLAVIDESPEQTKAGLNHVVADLDGLITDLRDRIYEIQ
jgi:signal transduction histidine kinase